MKIYQRPAIRVVSIEGDLMQEVLSIIDEKGDGQLTNEINMEVESPTPDTGNNSVWDE